VCNLIKTATILAFIKCPFHLLILPFHTHNRVITNETSRQNVSVVFLKQLIQISSLGKTCYDN